MATRSRRTDLSVERALVGEALDVVHDTPKASRLSFRRDAVPFLSIELAAQPQMDDEHLAMLLREIADGLDWIAQRRQE